MTEQWIVEQWLLVSLSFWDRVLAVSIIIALIGIIWIRAAKDDQGGD